MEELEKIDAIRERTGANYQQAVAALRDCNGDVLDAIIKIEEMQKAKCSKEEFQVKGEQLLTKIKDLIRRGNITRIKVKKDNKVLVNIPVTAGVVGTVIAPYLTVLAGVAALVSKCVVEVERVKTEESKLNNIIDNQD